MVHETPSVESARLILKGAAKRCPYDIDKLPPSCANAVYHDLLTDEEAVYVACYVLDLLTYSGIVPPKVLAWPMPQDPAERRPHIRGRASSTERRHPQVLGPEDK